MTRGVFDPGKVEITWCPGCGNHPILEALKKAYEEAGLDPTELVVVSGIGQAGKTPHYMKCHMFNGLHGRALPLATGIKAANPGLTVVAQGGDGDMYGEGGNHFIHAVRRNPGITCLVHNNMVYGLTKGQASPTSPRGMTTPVQVHGVHAEPLNPLAAAVALGVAFAARAFAGDREGLVEVVSAALAHKGFSVVDILQPCVTFNKVNTYQWFKERVAEVPSGHDPSDRMGALELLLSGERIYTGIIFRGPRRPTFEEELAPYREDDRPLFRRKVDGRALARHIRRMK